MDFNAIETRMYYYDKFPAKNINSGTLINKKVKPNLTRYALYKER